MDIQQYLPQLRKLFSNNGVILAYLFGSQAEGKVGPLSDVDIAVLFDPGIPYHDQSERQITLITELMGIFHRNDVDVVVLNRATPLLAWEVVRRGRAIYEPLPSARIGFETRALQRHVDTKPLRGVQNVYFFQRIEARRQSWSVSGGKRRKAMIQTDVVLERLRALEEYVEQLRPFQGKPMEEIVANNIVYWGVLHGLQLCIQSIMDVSSHMQAALSLERAPDYEGVILSLGKHGIIPMEFAERIRKMPSFRNIIVHEYLEVDEKIVHQKLQDGLDDFLLFIEHICDFLRKEGYIEGDEGDAG
jgi:uncharacterized protein YutE (UPF0331/DUF86 family)/predicted nucleotidyltransferase